MFIVLSRMEAALVTTMTTTTTNYCIIVSRTKLRDEKRCTTNDITRTKWKVVVQIWEILSWIKKVIPFRQSIILSGEEYKRASEYLHC